MLKKKVSFFIAMLTCHPLAWVGSISVTFASIFFIVYSILTFIYPIHNQYADIMFLAVIPPAFFGGLFLIPLGIYLRVKKSRQENLSFATLTPSQVIRSTSTLLRIRSSVHVFLFLTLANILLTVTIMYSGYHYMESNRFCGTACHTVMQPEYTAYQRSAHARVQCVDCHIGPGASWFVKSKLSGARQLVAVTMKTYNRPISTPIQHLRPSRETCEKCHWPDKFHGKKLKVITHFDTDRNNTKLYTVLLLNIGGTDRGDGKASGIHWHVNKGNRVVFISAKDERKDIPWVRFEKDGEKPVEYFYTGSKLSNEEIATAKKRVMECVDCHNRPTHVFYMPDEALDKMFRQNHEFQDIPFLKKVGLEILEKKFSEQDIQNQEVKKTLLTWYENKKTELGLIDTALLNKAAEEVQRIYRHNVWPQMKIGWGTYPDHISHTHFPGCLRCHGNTHRTKDGKAIDADCRLCHTILAIRKPDPTILKVLH